MTITEIIDSLEPITESGCLVWLKSQNHKGYGRVCVDGKYKMAHRAVYEYVRGPIPEGMQLDHLCRVRCCVNPEHLEPVSNRENTLRGVGRTAINARKVDCIRGHPLSGYNLVFRGGMRKCRICQNMSSKRYRARKRLRR